MLEHHASHVVLSLAHMCVEAARRGDEMEARRLARMSRELEDLFPEAKKELEERFGRVEERTDQAPGGDAGRASPVGENAERQDRGDEER